MKPPFNMAWGLTNRWERIKIPMSNSQIAFILTFVWGVFVTKRWYSWASLDFTKKFEDLEKAYKAIEWAMSKLGVMK